MRTPKQHKKKINYCKESFIEGLKRTDRSVKFKTFSQVRCRRNEKIAFWNDSSND